ncbi:MAG: hypothetical protein IPK71_08090 [Myxococcales bacterium]|jgi:phage tail tape-measure protein|nr:hypothetical protein [Myxococcales bacterium]
MARRTVASVCEEFANKAAKGPATLSVAPDLAIDVALELVRLGFKVAEAILDGVPDEEVRYILKTVLFSTAGGVVAGAAIGGPIGGLIAGPTGVKVGAAVGAAVGGAIGAAIATTVMVQRELGPKGQPRIVFTAG